MSRIRNWALGNTCDPFQGGLTCGNQAGTGACECGGTVQDSASCTTPVVDTVGKKHIVADGCSGRAASLNHCACANGPQSPDGGDMPCAPNGTTPDCCPVSGCQNLSTDSLNCGTCGAHCGTVPGNATGMCGSPDAGTVAGQCACDTGSVNSCPQTGVGGGRNCEISKCVCDGYKSGGIRQPCPTGSYCCAGEARPSTALQDIGCCSRPCGTDTNNVCVAAP